MYKLKTLADADVVLLHDEDLPRGCWKLAKVQGFITDRDGKVCGASLKVHQKVASQPCSNDPYSY